MTRRCEFTAEETAGWEMDDHRRAPPPTLHLHNLPNHNSHLPPPPPEHTHAPIPRPLHPLETPHHNPLPNRHPHPDPLSLPRRRVRAGSDEQADEGRGLDVRVRHGAHDAGYGVDGLGASG